jgi:hypothetical protein
MGLVAPITSKAAAASATVAMFIEFANIGIQPYPCSSSASHDAGLRFLLDSPSKFHPRSVRVSSPCALGPSYFCRDWG